MKAMSQTLVIVVAVVVILVTGLIVMAIFNQAASNVMPMFQAKAICQTEASGSCAGFDKLPATWNVQNKKYLDEKGEETTGSCANLFSGQECGCKDGVFKCGIPDD